MPRQSAKDGPIDAFVKRVKAPANVETKPKPAGKKARRAIEESSSEEDIKLESDEWSDSESEFNENDDL